MVRNLGKNLEISSGLINLGQFKDNMTHYGQKSAVNLPASPMDGDRPPMFYQFDSENKDLADKVIVRIKPTPRLDGGS